jgi:GAF domain-containing protein
MRRAGAEGLGAEHLRGCAVPMEDSPAAAVAHTGRSQTALDVKERMAYPAHLEQVPLRAAIAVPLGRPGTVRGVLSLAKQAGSQPFNEADLRMAEALGGQAAIALQAPPQAGQGRSLRGQVTELVEAAREQLGFMPGIRMEGPLDNTVPEQLRAVLREALSNVARHARASRSQVPVGVSEGTLLLEVSDDGVGIPEGGRRSGLRNMAERAEGGGSRLRWRVPLDRG